MKLKTIKDNDIKKFEILLYEEEMSTHTIEKYIRDVRKFQIYANGQSITKQLTLEYKEYLLDHYKVHSVNSYIVSLNRFLSYMKCYDEKIKTEKVQESPYLPESKNITKEEYMRLVEAAFQKGDERLALVMQTIASTGIRISELHCITVEAAKKQCSNIRNKGKNREILIPKNMSKLLLQYAKKHGIYSGEIFITRNGKSLNRSNIHKAMKQLCEEAHVEPQKVFPHNLRHLFAKLFYKINKDIAKLADILGHSSIDTTRIYLKTSIKEHTKMLNLMNLVLLKKSEQYMKKRNV